MWSRPFWSVELCGILGPQMRGLGAHLRRGSSEGAGHGQIENHLPQDVTREKPERPRFRFVLGRSWIAP